MTIPPVQAPPRTRRPRRAAAVPSTAPATTPSTDVANPNVLPLPEDGLNSVDAWKKRIASSLQVVDELKTQWEANQKLYEMKATGALTSKHVVVPDAYTMTEQKKAIFMAAVSDRVMVDPLQDGRESAAQVFEAVINYYLGDSENKCVNLPAAIDEVLSDLICPAGIAAVKIGYNPTIDGVKDVETGQMQPDPNFVPDPAAVAAFMQGLGPEPTPSMVPVMATIPNVISERYMFERISPVNVLLPSEFKGSVYDRANWVGHRFEMDFEVAKRAFTLPEDFEGSGNSMPRGINVRDTTYSNKRKVVTGVELYYKAAVYDPTVKNPELQRCLVFIDGVDEPVKHKDSDYQEVQPDGRITGMQGFPIHVTALRYMSDKAYVPSDVENIRFSVEEKSRHRTAQVLTRERSIPQRLASKSALGGDEGVAKLASSVMHSVIPVDTLAEGDPAVKNVDLSRLPQENMQFEAFVDQDIQKAMGMSPNQTGASSTGYRAAADVQLAASGSELRQGKEIAKFKRWVEKGIEKLASLIQMFATEPDVIRLTGEEGKAKWVEWNNKTIAGPFAFSISTDILKNRQEFVNFYNLAAPSPNINRYALDRKFVEKFGENPDKLLNQPQPAQPPKPEPPKISVTLDEKWLDPSNPAFPVAIALLRLSGVNVPDADVLLAQQAAALAPKTAAEGKSVAGVSPGDQGGAEPMGSTAVQPPADGQGSAEEAAKLNKHVTERTGELNGPQVEAAA